MSSPKTNTKVDARAAIFFFPFFFFFFFLELESQHSTLMRLLIMKTKKGTRIHRKNISDGSRFGQKCHRVSQAHSHRPIGEFVPNWVDEFPCTAIRVNRPLRKSHRRSHSHRSAPPKCNQILIRVETDTSATDMIKNNRDRSEMWAQTHTRTSPRKIRQSCP